MATVTAEVGVCAAAFRFINAVAGQDTATVELGKVEMI